MAQGTGKPYEEKPEGYLAAFWSHMVIILAFPHFFFQTAFQAWGLWVPAVVGYYNYFLAAVPLAPLITYLLYSAQRRKVEKEREAAWSRFQTLQAVYYQLTVLAIGFVIAPQWMLGPVPIGTVLYALGLAMIVYGVIGALLLAAGKFDFSYPVIGRLARRIVEKRYEKR